MKPLGLVVLWVKRSLVIELSCQYSSEIDSPNTWFRLILTTSCQFRQCFFGHAILNIVLTIPQASAIIAGPTTIGSICFVVKGRVSAGSIRYKKDRFRRRMLFRVGLIQSWAQRLEQDYKKKINAAASFCLSFMSISALLLVRESSSGLFDRDEYSLSLSVDLLNSYYPCRKWFLCLRVCN